MTFPVFLLYARQFFVLKCLARFVRSFKEHFSHNQDLNQAPRLSPRSNVSSYHHIHPLHGFDCYYHFTYGFYTWRSSRVALCCFYHCFNHFNLSDLSLTHPRAWAGHRIRSNSFDMGPRFIPTPRIPHPSDLPSTTSHSPSQTHSQSTPKDGRSRPLLPATTATPLPP